ncbi:hypothetical protein MLD38_027154 [Melastoma candidum]|uniref:Uncharacterized protein n=1 Tax=Melastoma candidum TaxID=119954 RepID=A0ACB9P0U1_9MYRT|nr:hypothetical protein MLD38_027154 [Melastoma candidum]
MLRNAARRVLIPRLSPSATTTTTLATSARSAIASSSVATEWVKGKQIEEVLSIKNTEIAKHLSLPPVKLHCSMLAEDAIKAAMKDYEAKRVKQSGSNEAPVEKAAAN